MSHFVGLHLKVLSKNQLDTFQSGVSRDEMFPIYRELFFDAFAACSDGQSFYSFGFGQDFLRPQLCRILSVLVKPSEYESITQYLNSKMSFEEFFGLYYHNDAPTNPGADLILHQEIFLKVVSVAGHMSPQLFFDQGSALRRSLARTLAVRGINYLRFSSDHITREDAQQVVYQVQTALYFGFKWQKKRKSEDDNSLGLPVSVFYHALNCI